MSHVFLRLFESTFLQNIKSMNQHAAAVDLVCGWTCSSSKCTTPSWQLPVISEARQQHPCYWLGGSERRAHCTPRQLYDPPEEQTAGSVFTGTHVCSQSVTEAADWMLGGTFTCRWKRKLGAFLQDELCRCRVIRALMQQTSVWVWKRKKVHLKWCHTSFDFQINWNIRLQTSSSNFLGKW